MELAFRVDATFPGGRVPSVKKTPLAIDTKSGAVLPNVTSQPDCFATAGKVLRNVCLPNVTICDKNMVGKNEEKSPHNKTKMKKEMPMGDGLGHPLTLPSLLCNVEWNLFPAGIWCKYKKFCRRMLFKFFLRSYTRHILLNFSKKNYTR